MTKTYNDIEAVTRLLEEVSERFKRQVFPKLLQTMSHFEIHKPQYKKVKLWKSFPSNIIDIKPLVVRILPHL